MNARCFFLVLALGVGSLASLPTVRGQASASPVPRPEKRQKVLELAAQLLQPRASPADNLPADLINPFQPDSPGREQTPVATGAGQPALPETDRDILQAVAPKIIPSGTSIVGGRPVLFFNQKKVKVGDALTITFGGTDYVLNVTGITSTTFTLRLNREEITRPIK